MGDDGGRGGAAAPPARPTSDLAGAPEAPVPRRSLRDLLAGGVFIAFGLAFAATSATYQLGAAERMGPGYFPLLLGGLLVALGVLTMVKGVLQGEPEPVGSFPWKALVLVLGAVLLFGVAVRGFGLVPTLFVTILLTALASHRSGPRLAATIAVALTALCVAIFVVALGLRLALLGPWLGG